MVTLVQHGSWPGWTPNADIYLSDAAAPQYLAMIEAYRSETGRMDGEIAEPVGGNRTAAQCAAMRNAFLHGTAADKAHWNLDPASKAVPSLSSPHIGGNCADIYATDFQWFINNSQRFGWRRTLVASGDVHHFQFFAGLATAGGGGTPVPVPVRPDLIGLKMRLLPQDDTSTYFLEVEGRGLYTVPDQAHVDMIKRYLDTSTAPLGLKRADINAVAAFIAGPPTYKTFWQAPSGGSGSTDLSAVLAQLSAIEKLEATDQAALVSAINALPAAVRAKIVAAP